MNEQQSLVKPADFLRMKRLDDPTFDPGPTLKNSMLEVGDGHSIYFETGGNPDGVPVVICHGGPGGSSDSSHRSFVDTSRYLCVQFDQRGTGRSTPRGEVSNNTLQDIIADMERLRAPPSN